MSNNKQHSRVPASIGSDTTTQPSAARLQKDNAFWECFPGGVNYNGAVAPNCGFHAGHAVKAASLFMRDFADALIAQPDCGSQDHDSDCEELVLVAIAAAYAGAAHLTHDDDNHPETGIRKRGRVLLEAFAGWHPHYTNPIQEKGWLARAHLAKQTPGNGDFHKLCALLDFCERTAKMEVDAYPGLPSENPTLFDLPLKPAGRD